MELDTNNHSVFKLNYHLLMVVKYRREGIDDTISTRLKTIFENIGANDQNSSTLIRVLVHEE